RRGGREAQLGAGQETEALPRREGRAGELGLEVLEQAVDAAGLLAGVDRADLAVRLVGRPRRRGGEEGERGGSRRELEHRHSSVVQITVVVPRSWPRPSWSATLNTAAWPPLTSSSSMSQPFDAGPPPPGSVNHTRS